MPVDEDVSDDKERDEEDEEDHAHGHGVDPHDIKTVVDDWDLEVAEDHDGDDDGLDQVAEGYDGSDSELLREFPEKLAGDQSENKEQHEVDQQDCPLCQF